MTQFINDIFAIDLTSLGDQYKSFRILPPDHVWTVPYLKYSYRSIYHTKRRGSDFYCSEEYPLEAGNWQLICTTKECTEEQAHKIVESVTTVNELPVYRDYEFSVWMKTAVGSLRSLLASKGLDINKNYVLIKKAS